MPRLQGVRVLSSVIAGAAVLGAVGFASRALDKSRANRVGVEAQRAAAQAMVRARDAVAVQVEGLQLMAHNAASNPRLIAAVSGRVDARTFADLFASESWWEPYRREVSVGISYDGSRLAFQQGSEVAGVSLGPILATVRAQRKSMSQLVKGKVRPAAVAASVVNPSGQHPAVLVFVKPLTDAMLNTFSVRAGAAVLLSDGKRAIATSGPADEVALLRQAVGHEAAGKFAGSASSWAATSSEVIPGVWLWTAGSAAAFARDEGAADSKKVAALWAGAVLITFGTLLLAFRRRRDDGAPAVHASGPVPLNVQTTPASAQQTGSWRTGTGTGIQLGRYFLLDRIGEGGMAEVFTAVSFGTNNFRRSFVVKKLRPEMTTNKEAVAQFVDEANLASSLVHPNIVPVFDFGQIGGEYFIAQEYIVGRDLGRLTRRMVEREAPALPLSAIMYIAHELLTALDYAHRKRDDDGSPLGIVHRDVTPENVMVSERGEVKLLDFGIVKATQGRVTRTEIGMVKGNVDFMSPEQARGRAIDARADLFSVGLVMYYLAAQQPLYTGDTLYDRLTKAATGPNFEDLARIANLPLPLPQILKKALAVNPDERYPSATDFRAAVASHVTGGGAELGRVVTQLFEDDLQLEQDRLSAAFPRPRFGEDAANVAG